MPDTPLNPDALDMFNALKDRLMNLTGSPGLTSFSAGKVHMTLGEWERLIEAMPPAALQEVTSDVYTVAIKNTEKSTGRVFFDYPGCTPEIGTLDDARELLNWVNEGTPSSPESPYSSEARIYKLTEVNDA